MDVRPGLTGLLAFLSFLQDEHLEYYFLHTSPDDFTVCFALPGQRFEVRFEETRVDWCVFAGDDGCNPDFSGLLEIIRNKDVDPRSLNDR